MINHDSTQMNHSWDFPDRSTLQLTAMIDSWSHLLSRRRHPSENAKEFLLRRPQRRLLGAEDDIRWISVVDGMIPCPVSGQVQRLLQRHLCCGSGFAGWPSRIAGSFGRFFVQLTAGHRWRRKQRAKPSPLCWHCQFGTKKLADYCCSDLWIFAN